MTDVTQEILSNQSGAPNPVGLDMKIEVMVLPVSDVDCAKEFYQRLVWRLDPTLTGVVQLTPHGSPCSVQFGGKLTSAAPGSAKGYVIVSNIDAARNTLLTAGIEVDEIFHIGTEGPVPGPDPEHRTYRSRALFTDPDGNSWVLQEVTGRLPGRIDTGVTSFGSTSDLASALRGAAAANGQPEARLGPADENWPDWYAEYMSREQNGQVLPKRTQPMT